MSEIYWGTVLVGYRMLDLSEHFVGYVLCVVEY